MVMRNHVLTGVSSCHRNLEHAVLELTLLKLSHPNDSIVHPAVYQDREKLLAFLGTIFLQSLDRQEKKNPANTKWGTEAYVAF